MGEEGGKRGRTLGIGVPQGPLFALLFCFYDPVRINYNLPAG